MDNLLMWNTEDWTDHESYERMLEDHGGMEYKAAQKQAIDAGSALERTLVPGQRDLYHAYADAVVDATAARETVATRIALIHGIAIGATMAEYGDEDPPDKLIGLATGLTTTLLASGLFPGIAVSVLETIRETFDRANQGAGMVRQGISSEDLAGGGK